MKNPLHTVQDFQHLKAKYDAQAKMLRTDWDSAEYTTFSGADIQCAFYFPNQALTADHHNYLDYNIGIGGLKVWAQLQTLTLSSARTVDPVRILGNSAPTDWTRGSRTIAGTMIFTDILRDVFAEFLSLYITETSNRCDYFVDQIPPFNIILNAINEAGIQATRAVVGVNLTNYGTIYSIDDLLTESTYTYVARAVTPFMQSGQWREKIRDIIQGPGLRVNAASRRQLPVSTWEHSEERIYNPGWSYM